MSFVSGSVKPQGFTQAKYRLPRSLKGLFGSVALTCDGFECDGDRLLNRVATDLFESLNTPISLSCEIMLRYGEHLQLVQHRIDPMSYNDPFKFRDDYQAVSFLKKVPFRKKGFDPRGQARLKFLEAEEACRVTNLRIRNFLVAPERASDVVRKAFCLASHKIDRLLATLSFDDWLTSCRFGPGTFNAPGSRGLTSIYDKLQVTPSVTHDFLEPGAILVKSSPSWARSLTGIEDFGAWPLISTSDLTPVLGNRVTFVPKTAITDRAIAIEPLVNIYAQLGLGKLLRRKLRRIGVNLDDQSPNQVAALKGSIDGSLATIDLSSASDTVAKELVRALLPEQWYHAFDSCRSKIGSLDGKSFVYEKFSSMGNGFTFELETLIFHSFALAACEIAGADTSLVNVYGDDIVVPVTAFETLEETLTFFGFTLNKAKSFNKGYFRESCGKDYFDGIDVRPFFTKEVPKRVDSLFRLHNGLLRLASRHRRLYGNDGKLHQPWRSILQTLPKSVVQHCRVPAHAGDSDGLITNWDLAQGSSFVVPSLDGWEGYFGLRYQATAITVREASNFLGGVASLLYRLKDGLEDTEYSPANPRQGRDYVFRLRAGAFYGPWTELTFSFDTEE
jgi:hypothetical protein